MSTNPDNSGRGNRGGRGGRGGRRGRGFPRPGRPLTQSDNSVVFNLWQSLNTVGRMRFAEMILTLARSEFPEQFGNHPSGESQGTQSAPDDHHQAPPSKEDKAPSAKKEKIWERSILRDIPRFQAFGKLSSKERGEDKDTSRLMSIVTGVISRGRRLKASDENILNSVLAHLDSEEFLKRLFTEVPSDDVRRQGGIPDGVPTPRYWWISSHQWMDERGGLIENSQQDQDQSHMEVEPPSGAPTGAEDGDEAGASPPSATETLADLQRDVDKLSVPQIAAAFAASLTGGDSSLVPEDSSTANAAKSQPKKGGVKSGTVSWASECESSEESDQKPKAKESSPRSSRRKRRESEKEDKPHKRNKKPKGGDEGKGNP